MFRVLLLLLALSAGGGAAWLALAVQEDQPAFPAAAELAPKLATEDVLVAAADVGQGQRLGPESLRWQAWPEDAVHTGFIARSVRPEAPDELEGSLARMQIVAGEPIRPEKLVRTDAGFLSAVLPAGKRAVAVRVSAESAAGGFVLPNDRVDVLHTVARPVQTDGQPQSVTRTILRNIRVLAIDQSAQQTDSETALGKTATLEVDPRQAEVLAGAEGSGLLLLSLRSVADNAEQEKRAELETRRVRFIRGGQSEMVNVR